MPRVAPLELPPADLARAEAICRFLADSMTGEALAVLSAAVALTISRINPLQEQDAFLSLVLERSADELRLQQDERNWSARRRG